MAEIVAETARLILRTQSDGDVDIWLKHMNTPEVRDHLGGVREPHEVEAMFAKMAADRARDGTGFLLIQHKAEGTMIGNVGLIRYESETAPATLLDTVHIGWSLRADYWRQGFAMEAASALLDRAFERLNLPIVYAMTADRNVASWRMMDRLGMARRRELDFDDPEYAAHDNPTIVYSLTAQAWKDRSTA